MAGWGSGWDGKGVWAGGAWEDVAGMWLGGKPADIWSGGTGKGWPGGKDMWTWEGTGGKGTGMWHDGVWPQEGKGLYMSGKGGWEGGMRGKSFWPTAKGGEYGMCGKGPWPEGPNGWEVGWGGKPAAPWELAPGKGYSTAADRGDTGKGCPMAEEWKGGPGKGCSSTPEWGSSPGKGSADAWAEWPGQGGWESSQDWALHTETVKGYTKGGDGKTHTEVFQAAQSQVSEAGNVQAAVWSLSGHDDFDGGSNGKRARRSMHLSQKTR